MKRWGTAGVALLAALWGCGDPGAPRFSGAPPPVVQAFGTCAFCHSGEADGMLPVAASLNCTICHADARPGFAGPGHRALPGTELVPSYPPTGHRLGADAAFGSCAFCHNDTSGELRVFAGFLRCETCHTAVLAASFGPRHRSLPSAGQVPSAPPQAHAAGANAAWGHCALCHDREAQDLTEVLGGPGELACSTCHSERSPGVFGPGHFTLPSRDIVPAPPPRAHRPQAERAWGSCALCHNAEARAVEAVLGSPEDLRCDTCHSDRAPGRYGPGHRARPLNTLVPDAPSDPHRPSALAATSASCAFCHSRLAEAVGPVTDELACSVCHAEAAAAFGPGHRRLPDVALVPAFVGADHALGRWQRFGVCAYCHRDLGENVEASNAAELGCIVCHRQKLGEYGPAHRSLPGADLVPDFVGASHFSDDRRIFGTCAFCHSDTAERGLELTHGSLAVECSRCHVPREGEPLGKGHQSVAPCAACHGTSRRTHHDPAEGTAQECAVCHNPHGSRNVFLVREAIRTPMGLERGVRFENLRGSDDAGFTAATRPGSGLCEVCHTTTRYFRGDGTGDPHFVFPCFTCHPHALGFSVRP
ncbi:MAG: hypothetical protein KatS3mg077_1772 [Candidatus Binatia bacterium]|nr:MAG: hypothetical protein KatS3mg077_1772 [Candidatus Binatia bacterium]